MKQRHAVGNRTLAHTCAAINGHWRAGKRCRRQHKSRGRSTVTKIDAQRITQRKSSTAAVHMNGIVFDTYLTTKRTERAHQTVGVL
jgi:hypothetical protein